MPVLIPIYAIHRDPKVTIFNCPKFTINSNCKCVSVLPRAAALQPGTLLEGEPGQDRALQLHAVRSGAAHLPGFALWDAPGEGGHREVTVALPANVLGVDAENAHLPEECIHAVLERGTVCQFGGG
uniref:(northern house mosquito) hypothetical protein n=1 Tax=Culex pipiens TaxID=7175 RepID=A0A8D8B5Y5_CULPI